jgi:hypothetical protein
MDSGIHTVQMVSSGFSWMVGVGLWIGLLVVVLTAVRRHRPDAMRLLLMGIARLARPARALPPPAAALPPA